MKEAKQYFDNHDKVGQLYFTSDNLAFFEEQNAINHAKHLGDATITVMTREEANLAVNDITNEYTEDDLFDEFEAE